MDLALTERRIEARVPPASLGIEAATVRPGFPIRVVNISPGGAHVESGRPLRPGRRVHLRLTAGGRSLGLSAVTLRCAVCALDRATGAVYRSALRFEDRTWPLGLHENTGRVVEAEEEEGAPAAPGRRVARTGP